jgi:hypothetical protein
MRVMSMVAVLMFGLAGAFYDMSVEVWANEGTADVGQVTSFDDYFPPPPPPPSQP